MLQGAAAAALQPSEQAILADTFPPEKRGMAFAVYGMAVVMAPAIGPTLGGWITDNYSWRWIFFLNIPVGILSLYLSNRMVEDPPYLAEVKKRREGIDSWGLGLLVVGHRRAANHARQGPGGRLVLLPVHRACAVTAVVAFAIFLYREMHVEHPILDLRLYMQRNVGMTQLVLFMVGLSLYTSTVFIPLFLQEIMGYNARQAGTAVSSGAIVLMFLFPLAGMFAPKFDPRKLVAIGFVITTIGLIRMATSLNLEVSFWQAVSWRAFIALGLPFLFIPINMLCYAGIPQHKNNEISGMSALSRNLGGSVGISFMTTMLARLTQRHLAFLGANAVPGNGPFEAMRSGLAGALQQRTGIAQPDAIYRAGAQIYGMAQRQARLLAYVDVIWVFVIITVILVPMPFLMRRPKKTGPAIVH